MISKRAFTTEKAESHFLFYNRTIKQILLSKYYDRIQGQILLLKFYKKYSAETNGVPRQKGFTPEDHSITNLDDRKMLQTIERCRNKENPGKRVRGGETWIAH